MATAAWAFARLVLGQVLLAFATAITKYFADRRALAAAQEAGRLKAEADAAKVAAAAAERMGNIALPSDADVITELKQGTG